MENLWLEVTLPVPAAELALQAGTIKAANVVLLGALSSRFPYEPSVWEEVISKRVPPKTVQANLAALSSGRAFMEEAIAEQKEA